MQSNDLVLDQHGRPTKVIKLKSSGFNKSYILYHFENGIDIKAPFPHRFYNADLGFWEHLHRWKIGEHAVMADGTKVALISKEKIKEPEEGFGLFTEAGGYYANGLLSGPARCNKKLLTNKKLAEAVRMARSITTFQSYKLLKTEDLTL
jgi:hypothetical protein